MSAFVVTVRQLGLPDVVYPAIGPDSASVQMAAYDHYGACGVSVTPA